jgi:DNA-binding beta-propeller fold protein YncE
VGPPGGPAIGDVTLTAGAHAVDLRYAWQGGPARLLWLWAPAGGAPQIVPPTVLRPLARSWPRGAVPDPEGTPDLRPAPPPAAVVTPAAVIAAGQGLTQPRGLAVDGRGDIFIADTGSHRVLRLDAAGKVLGSWGKAGDKPGSGLFNTLGDIAATPDGHIVTMDSASGDLEIFSAAGQSIRYLPGVAPQANGIAVGPDGRIWIAHTGGNRVLVLKPDGQVDREVVGGAPDTRQKFEQPVDVAVAPDGTVYVIDLKARIAQLDAAGTVVREWPVEIGVARGGSRLTVWQGKVVMTDPDRGRLVVLDPASGDEQLIGAPGANPGQFALPLGVAAGPDGRLYVLDSDNARVQVFSSLTGK